MKTNIYEESLSCKDFLSFQRCFHLRCEGCKLANRKEAHSIVWRGNEFSKILLVGEALGKIEEKQKKIFVGPAGEVLDKLFTKIDIDIEKHLLLTNCVFCRPCAPGDSDKQNIKPDKEVIDKCWPLTEKLIELVQPKIIIPCGSIAAQKILDDKKVKITKICGEWKEIDGVHYIPMLHPASLLHSKKVPERRKQYKELINKFLINFRDEWKERLGEDGEYLQDSSYRARPRF